MKLLLVIILLILLIFISIRTYSGNVRHYSSVDHAYYFVNNKHSHETKTVIANKLGTIRKKGDRLIHTIKSDPYLRIQNNYKRLLRKWSQLQIEELNVKGKEIFAFNVNKGYKIYLCVLDNDVNDIMFVFLHELTHIMTSEIGHPPQFWTNFKELLELAIKNDIYTYQNYNEKHAKFCNFFLDSTPLINK